MQEEESDTAARVGEKMARRLGEEPSRAAREVNQVIGDAFRQGKIRSVAMARSVHGHSVAASGAYFQSARLGSVAAGGGMSIGGDGKGLKKAKKSKKSKKSKSHKSRSVFENPDDLL